MDILERLNLKIGSRIDILLENKQVHISMIEDVADDKYLLISAPVFQGKPVILRRDEEITLIYVLETGRFGISARVVGFKVEGAARLVAVQTHGNPRRHLLRDAYRLSATLKALLRDNTEGPFPVTPPEKKGAAQTEECEKPVVTTDISESGVSFKTKTKYEVDDKVYLKIWFEWPEPNSEPLEFYCVVKRRELVGPDDTYRVGAKFLGNDGDTRKLLARYILVRQQQILKQRRLVEDD